MRLKDKVAIITGSGSGIGCASAVLFAKEGAKVVVADIVRKGGLETVEMIMENRGDAIFVETDVTNKTDVERMVKTAVEKYGKLDILYNNAGFNLEKTVTDTTEEEWNKVLDVNLKSVFLCSKYAIPELIRNGGGAIINTASMVGVLGALHESAYCAAKAGVILLTKAMALDYGPYKIRVNCVSPGGIKTPMHNEFIATLPESERDKLEKHSTNPLRRIGQPEEVAYTALFLASDEASYISGVTLPVHGGSRH